MAIRTLSSLEVLEPRIAPAGLIDVSLKNGILTLKSMAADDGDERATVRRDTTTGILRIEPGLDVSLRFNGAVSTDPLEIAGVVFGLNASLGKGNDSLALANAQFTKPVKIALGEGTTSNTDVNSAFVGGSFRYVGGFGNDTFRLDGSSVAGSVLADGGRGNDQFQIEWFGGSRTSFFGGAVTFKGGAGSDNFLIAGDAPGRNAEFRRGLLLDGGEETDSVTIGTLATVIAPYVIVQKNIP